MIKPTAFRIEGPDVYDIPILFEGDMVSLRDALTKAIHKYKLRRDESIPPYTVSALYMEKIRVEVRDEVSRTTL